MSKSIIIYTLRYTMPHAEHGFLTGNVWGSFSSLENAQAEAQRYSKHTLQWQSLDTDDNRCRGMWRAPLTNWATEGCEVEIVAFRLDSRKFRGYRTHQPESQDA